MSFINPIEILQLQDAPYPDSIDSGIIKRQKRKLFAEIELSEDGDYSYYGTKIQKSDCERIIEELSNNDKKEYYYQLATTIQPLNEYLVSGDEKFFSHFKQESIYKLSDFINFINPAYAQNFDRSLLKAFRNNDRNWLSSILRTQMLVNSTNITTAFKSLSIELQNRISQIDKIKNDIKSEGGVWNNGNIDVIVDFVKKVFPVDILNILPTYFQSPINKIADSINLLGKAIWETYDNVQATNDLLAYLLQLNIGSVDKKTFEDNFKIVKRRNDERIEQEKNAPSLKKWAYILSEIKNDTKRVDEKVLIARVAAKLTIDAVKVTELNGLLSFADEIRNQIGYALRSLSISSWNNQKDINTALKLISHALAINVSQDAKQKFQSDLKDLQEIYSKTEQERIPTPQVRSLSKSEAKSQTFAWFMVLIIIIITIIWSISNSNNLNNQTRLPVNSNDALNNSSSSAGTDSSSSASPYSKALPDQTSNNSYTTEPIYKSVTLKNGNFSGCSEIRSKYDKRINTRIIITTESTDAAVKLYDYETDRCIRFVFINEGTTYTMKNIPEGKYYLKIAYGNGWEVKKGDPICEGRFVTNASYKKDNSLYNFYIEHHYDGSYSVPYFKLTLYRKYTTNNYDDNSSGNPISEDDFNNN